MSVVARERERSSKVLKFESSKVLKFEPASLAATPCQGSAKVENGNLKLGNSHSHPVNRSKGLGTQDWTFGIPFLTLCGSPRRCASFGSEKGPYESDSA